MPTVLFQKNINQYCLSAVHYILHTHNSQQQCVSLKKKKKCECDSKFGLISVANLTKLHIHIKAASKVYICPLKENNIKKHITRRCERYAVYAEVDEQHLYDSIFLLLPTSYKKQQQKKYM